MSLSGPILHLGICWWHICFWRLFREVQGCCKASVLQGVAWAHLSLLSGLSCCSFTRKIILVWFLSQRKNENSTFLKLPLKTQNTLNTSRFHSSDRPVSTTKISGIFTIFVFLPLFSLFLPQCLPLKINATLPVRGFKINWLYTEKVSYSTKMRTLGLFPHGAEPGRAKHWRFPWQELSPQSSVYLGQSLYLSGPRVLDRKKNRETVNYCKTSLSSELQHKHCIRKCFLCLNLSAFTI